MAAAKPARAGGWRNPSWRGVTVLLFLFGGAAFLVAFGMAIAGGDAQLTARAWMAAARDSGPWGAAAAIIGFVVLAMIGAPQIILVAACAIAFGPWPGFAYAWTGNLLACAAGFGIGRALGAKSLSQMNSPRIARFLRVLSRHGLIASMLVRWTPSGPFMMVNIAAGITPIRFSDYLAGSLLGSTPKIALIVFAGHSLTGAVSGNGVKWLSVALSLGLWILIAWAARVLLAREERLDQAASLNSEGDLKA
ncbi:MAG: TVP38/TMEM64 family protein [Caulobacteraceae bacterium]